PEKPLRYGNEPGFALNRLDDQCGDRGGIDLRDQCVLELPDPEIHALLFARPGGRAIDARDWKPDDLRSERTEAALEQSVLARQAQREERAPVIPAFETDDRRPA